MNAHSRNRVERLRSVRCHTASMQAVGADPSARSNLVIIRVGGFSLIIAAVVFVGVFSYLSVRFSYPDVLDGRAADVLPALLATGDIGRAVWAVYALLPLLWIPAAVGAFHALRVDSEGRTRVGMLFALVSSLAMVAGLIRWPSFHWELAKAWRGADANARVILETVFDATNLYLGNYVGEFLGECAANVFFLLAASAMIKRTSGFASWVGWFGAVTGVAGLVGMFRNVVAAVAPVAEVNNFLLPLWMIIFGVSLLQYRRARPAALGVVPTAA
jgi:hypothetical protein